eukprot:586868-Hanusia_phi.AAC.1
MAAFSFPCEGFLDMLRSSTSSKPSCCLSDLLCLYVSSSHFLEEASLALTNHQKDLAMLQGKVLQGHLNLSDEKDAITLLIGGNQVRISESNLELLPGSCDLSVSLVESSLIIRLVVIGNHASKDINSFSISMPRGSKISQIKQFIAKSCAAVSKALDPETSQPLASSSIMLIDMQGRIMQDEEVAAPSYEHVTDQCFHVSFICSLALPDDDSLQNLKGSAVLTQALSMICKAGREMSDSLSTNKQTSEDELDFDLIRWKPFMTMIQSSRSLMPPDFQTASLYQRHVSFKEMRSDLSKCPEQCASCIEKLLKEIDSLDPAMGNHLAEAFDVLMRYVSKLAMKDKPVIKSQMENLTRLRDQLNMYAEKKCGHPTEGLSDEMEIQCQRNIKGFNTTFKELEKQWQAVLAWEPHEFDRLDEETDAQILKLTKLQEEYGRMISSEEEKMVELKKHREEAKLIRDKATSMVDWCLQIDHAAEQGCVTAIGRIDREMQRLNAIRSKQTELLKNINLRKTRLTNLQTSSEQKYIEVSNSIAQDIVCANSRISKARKSYLTVTKAVAEIPTLKKNIAKDVQDLRTYAEELKKCIACDCWEACAGAHNALTVDLMVEEDTNEEHRRKAMEQEKKLKKQQTKNSSDPEIRSKIQRIQEKLERTKTSLRQCKCRMEGIAKQQADLKHEYEPILKYLQSEAQSVSTDILKVYTTDRNIQEWCNVWRNESTVRVLEMAHVFEEKFKEDFRIRNQRIDESVENRWSTQNFQNRITG